MVANWIAQKRVQDASVLFIALSSLMSLGRVGVDHSGKRVLRAL